MTEAAGEWETREPGVDVEGPCEITFSTRPAQVTSRFVVRLVHEETGETIYPVRHGADAPGGWGHVFRPVTPGRWRAEVYGPSGPVKGSADTSGVGE